MTPPRATYRLQFRGGTGFRDGARLAGYLARLGVDTLYASPLMQAVPDSTHGYDGIDYNRLDPILGGRAGFDAMVGELSGHGLGLLLDIVPNHLAASPLGPWWRDVLEWGAASRYAGHFAIDWSADRLLVPVLGRGYGEELDSGSFELAFDKSDGSLAFSYHGIRLPLTPPSYAQVLALLPGKGHAELARRFAAATPEDAAALKADLAGSDSADGLPDVIARLADDRATLHELHEAQVWRLAHWRLARETLTYRRFFEIADLVGVRVESGQVFDDAHALVRELAASGTLAGLRIDHVDGLADPRDYLRRLDEEIAGPHCLHVLVEKILAHDEVLPDGWRAAGTTGYEFIAALAGLFTDPAGEAAATATYEDYVGGAVDYAALVRQAKRATISRNLAGELETLKDQARSLAARDPRTRDLGPDTLRRALIELVAAMPAYRTYIDVEGAGEADRALLDRAASTARATREIEDEAAIDFLVRMLRLDLATPDDQAAALAFAARFQQSTAPVMAKAVEDTAFYRYSRLVALNEVGGEPDRFGAPPADFHTAMADRLNREPGGLSTTATHDTKRGEDARARLYALSEMPEGWAAAVAGWSNRHASLHRRLGAVEAPGPDLRWLFYQALAGAWPPGLAAGDRDRVAELSGRLADYMVKAAREAKLHTSWTDPDADYEAAVSSYVGAALTDDDSGGFLEQFVQTCRPLFMAGAVTSLAQTLAKLAAPGIPDIYQGCELWDHSLVDPDNRRPVDFGHRERLLARLEAEPSPAEILAEWEVGLPKLHLLRRALALRREMPRLFAAGDYLPLAIEGDLADHALAFARLHEGDAVVALLPRLVLNLAGDQPVPLVPPERWGRTSLLLPAGLPHCWHDVLSERAVDGADDIPLSDLLVDFPVALIVGRVR